MWKVCLQTFRNNRIFLKLAYFLRNLQTSRANNLGTLRIRNAKFSRNCFCINTNISGGFQIFTSVSLKCYKLTFLRALFYQHEGFAPIIARRFFNITCINHWQRKMMEIVSQDQIWFTLQWSEDFRWKNIHVMLMAMFIIPINIATHYQSII